MFRFQTRKKDKATGPKTKPNSPKNIRENPRLKQSPSAMQEVAAKDWKGGRRKPKASMSFVQFLSPLYER